MRGPNAIEITAEVDAMTLPESTEIALDALAASTLGPPRAWSNVLGNDTPRRAGDAEIRAAAQGLDDSIRIHVPGEDDYLVVRLSLSSTGAISGHLATEKLSEDAIRARVRDAVSFVAALGRSKRSPYAAVERIGGGADVLPDVPLVRGTSYGGLFTVAEVVEDYDDPQAFWDAGWSSIEDLGTVRIAVRALDAVSAPDYLRAVEPHQRALARAAKPGRTTYYDGRVSGEELAVYEATPRHLQASYSSADQALVLTAVLEPGQHIAGQEIDGIFRTLGGKKLPDGRPLKEVRVVFSDETAARTEKRPLLDVGARVFHLGDDGQLVEHTS